MKSRFIFIFSAIIVAAFANSAQKDFNCSNKKYCSEMISCEEAYFYLNKCGHTERDGDKDGVPCEKICGSNY